jgi:hypothetical protein
MDEVLARTPLVTPSGKHVVPGGVT